MLWSRGAAWLFRCCCAQPERVALIDHIVASGAFEEKDAADAHDSAGDDLLAPPPAHWQPVQPNSWVSRRFSTPSGQGFSGPACGAPVGSFSMGETRQTRKPVMKLRAWGVLPLR